MMLCTAPQLRTAALSCRMQPTLLSASPYHTAAPPASSRDTSSSSSSQRRIQLPKTRVLFRRTESTAASPPKHASSSPLPPPPPGNELLDWNTFFKLRKSRRMYQLGSSVGTGLNGFILGAQVLSRSDMDALVSQIPLDPFITLGLITFTCGGLGWLAGPILGTAVFNFKNRKFKEQMATKEKLFYARVKKYRVDPSASSMMNPVPDYYGEKISSVTGYRQWLKDQRAFNRKRQRYV